MNSKPPPVPDHVKDLMLRYLDSHLNAAEVEELNGLLRSNAHLLRQMAFFLLQEVQLAEVCQEQLDRPALDPQPADTLRSDEQWWLRIAHLFRSQPKWMAGLAVVFVGLCCLVFLGPSGGQGAQLVEVEGSVMVENILGRHPARLKARLKPGDRVLVSPGGAATLGYPQEATQLRLSESAHVRINENEPGKSILLEEGALTAAVAPQRPGNPMRIRTAQGEIEVMGTEFALHLDQGVTRLEVWSGRVKLTRRADGESAVVGGGQSARAAEGLPLHPEISQGGVLREAWRGIAGSKVGDLTSSYGFPERPTETGHWSNLELSEKVGESYGIRLRGWLHAPEPGEYLFWIAADDQAELWLSSDERPEHKRRVCFTPRYTAASEWDGHPAQRSGPVAFVPGRNYYLEVLMKQSGGAENLAVSWQGPHMQRQIVTGSYLTPISSPATSSSVIEKWKRPPRK